MLSFHYSSNQYKQPSVEFNSHKLKITPPNTRQDTDMYSKE